MHHLSISAVGPAALSAPALRRCPGTVCPLGNNAGDAYSRRAR
jgi:hypothetical protein